MVGEARQATGDPTGWIIAACAVATLVATAARRLWRVRVKKRDRAVHAESRVRVLEVAVLGEGEATWENPHPRPGLVAQMDEALPLLHAIAERVGVDHD